jgi:hypothetical protein
MLSFKQFIAEMQASNDNPDKEIRDEFVRLHKNRNNLDSMEERKYEILKNHPAVKNHPILNKLSESKTLKALVAATMLATTPAQAGGMAHELPVHSYEEIQNPNVSRETIERSKLALEKAQDEYDESMPGQHLSDAIDAHNNGDIKAAMEHLGIHNKMINKRQSAPMS